jgi:DNA-binding MarR family transcriptional regulator
MDPHVRLAGELTALLRSLKELHAHVVESASVACEPAAAVALTRLDKLGPVRLTTLAAELGLDPSSASRQVAALERAGLVGKEKDDTDQRACLLVLTPEGRAAATTLRSAFGARLAERTPGFTAAEVEDLSDRLARFNADLTAHRGHAPRLENA